MLIRRLAALALLVAFCLVTGAAAAPPKDAMVIGLLAEPVTMDPPQITDLNSARVTKRIFEGLVAQELGSYKLVPGLAQSWDISQGRAHLHLQPAAEREVPRRHAVQRRGGEVLLRAPAERQGPVLRDRHLPVREGLPRQRRGRRGGRTRSRCRSSSRRRSTPFLQYLAHQSLFVYSPEALKKWGKDIVKHPVGTGPFKLETWEPGVKVVLARNDAVLGRRAQGPPGHLRADHRGPGAAGRHQDRRDRSDHGRAARQPRRPPQGSQRGGGRDATPRRSGTWRSTRGIPSSRTSACARR